MEGDAGSGSARPDAWGSAVASGDATGLAELVLLWCGVLPHPALSILRRCVAVLEKEVALSAPTSSPLPSPQTSRGRNFNQPIKDVRWPDSLQTLSFGEFFNQPIKQVSWPASLRELTVGRNFNQNTAGARWPPGLVRRGAL
ncbi:conserved unknown protein [Ectocarpus siliculosus]|uniref:Uncharacterized protein n=1 Tax=Ectocarpus siliculosus TaxID=2880 RepID=D7FTA8_ECTSI|nr:conserved unknown protein [Ectocarpus siliculosus]|eukprot:CBJ31374.1 conserved unknown protein [Ectocarpus siliculosus]